MSRKFAIRFRLFAFLLVLVFPLFGCRSHATHSDELTGLWAFRVPNGGTGFFKLNQNGNSIRGTDIGFRQMALNGTVEDGVLHMEGSFTHAGHTYGVTYDGTIHGSVVEMTERKPVTINGNGEMVIHGTLERTTHDEIYPTALPLPALRNVPYNGLAKLPPMGWSSWNLFHTKIDDRTIRGIADAMVSSGMSKVGYQYVNIDGGWEGTRDAQGNLRGNGRFPDMKALADYVHSKGLKIGIYSSPGPRSCGGYTASYGHVDQDARTFAAWGYDFLKYDWCTAGLIYPSTDLRSVYQEMGEALLHTGRPIVYSLSIGSPGVWTWAAKAGPNLWRTTSDITDTWESIEKIGFNQVQIGKYATPGHWNDPDSLEVGNGALTPDEDRTQMSLWALLRAPLIAGNDLRIMTPEVRDILTNGELIAIDQDRAALPVEDVMHQQSTDVYRRRLSGGAWAIGLFNRGTQANPIQISWSALGIHIAVGHTIVRNVWTHQIVSVSGNSYTANVPSHGVVLLRISAPTL